MKKYFKIFILISFVFLIVALIKADYLNLPHFNSLNYLFFSFLFLLISFIFFILRWFKFLEFAGYKVSFRDATISLGLSVFGKYIPGKVMLIIGQAMYFSQKYGYSTKQVSALALQNQFVLLWLGSIVGSVPLFFIDQDKIHYSYILLFIILVSVFIFTDLFHKILNFLISKISKKNIHIPQLSFVSTLKILPYTLVDLIFRAAGFYFLIYSVSGEHMHLSLAFLFILAQVLGIISIFAPAGLGVREGILVLLLTISGFELKLAIQISVLSRVWYFVGELLIFISALILNIKRDEAIKK